MFSSAKGRSVKPIQQHCFLHKILFYCRQNWDNESTYKSQVLRPKPLIKSFIQIIHLDIDNMINAGLRFGLSKKKTRRFNGKTEENKLHLLFTCARVESYYSTGVNELGHWDKHEWSLNSLIIITLEMFFVQFCYRVNQKNCCIWGWEQKIGVINLLIFIQ